jgi:hypothetical protein
VKNTALSKSEVRRQKAEARTNLAQWLRVSALGGAIVWLVILGCTLARWVWRGEIELLVMFAALVIVPLGLAQAATPSRKGQHRWSYRAATMLQPLGAALVVIAFALPAGEIAAALAGGWFCFTLLGAFFGLQRLLSRPNSPVGEVNIDAALMMLPVSGVWLIISRAGLRPFTFDPRIVLLTAIHFHYAGFGANLITGMVGRKLSANPSKKLRQVLKWIAAGVIVAPLLVAIGITFSDEIEIVGVSILTLSLLTLAGLILGWIVPKEPSRWVRYLLIASAGSLFAPMLFAFAYTAKELFNTPAFEIPAMVYLHGMINAFGFVLCGLLAWTILQPAPRVAPPGIPFSKLRGGLFGKIGPDFFKQSGAIQLPSPESAAPEGLVDNLHDYRRPDFDTDNINPQVRDFYEHTLRYELLVKPQWQPGFRWASRLFHVWSGRVGQLNLPLAAAVQPGEDCIASVILPLNDQKDGRNRVRAWVRTYSKTGQAIYVAAYSSHTFLDETFMNIAFPLPGGNLTSILHLENLDEAQIPAGGVVLTTLPHPQRAGDEGVYFATRWGAVRLPVNETITVWPVEAEPALNGGLQPTIAARHDMWLCGFKYLTLDYQIYEAAYE